MGQEKKPHDKATHNYRPSGAIFVTTVVTVVSLVLWFGTYILYLGRG